MLKHRASVASAIFIMMLIIPMLAQFVSGARENVSALENRALASWPPGAVLVNDWPAYPGEAEAWMRDHLGLRAWLIGVHQNLREAFDLDLSKRAVRGTDGWLFATVDEAMAMYQGLRPFADGQAEDWLAAAQTIQARANANGAAFAVLIGPNKLEVYSEFLEDYPRLLAGPGRAETLAARAGQAGLSIVYPRDELIAAKDAAQVYFKTDTHWTAQGAYIAYRALMKAVNEAGLDVPAISAEQYGSVRETQKTGDIYALLGEAPPAPETLLDLVPGPAVANERTILEAHNWGAFDATRTRRLPLDGARQGRSVLVLGDSFYYGLAPFLEASFESVTFAHHRGLRPPMTLIDEGGYDLVLLMTVERGLKDPLRIEPAQVP